MQGLSKLLIATFTVIISIFFVFYASAQQPFTKSYDPATKTVTINSGANKLLEFQLISNTDQCLVDCEATIRIRPYVTLTLPSSANDNFKWNFLKANSNSLGLQGYSFEILETIPYTVNNYKQICNPYNVTEANGTWTVGNCTEILESSYTAYRYEYKPSAFWGHILEAGKDHYIKLKGKKYASIGPNNIEWIPTFHGLQLNEFAWWNGSWVYRKPINITAPVNSNVPERFVINVTFNHSELVPGKSLSNGADIRIVWTNASTGQDFEIPRRNITAWNDPSNNVSILFRIMENITQGISNASSYYMYYGYYGSSNVTNPFPEHNESMIYPFFDDIEDGDISDYTQGGAPTTNTSWADFGRYSIALDGGDNVVSKQFPPLEGNITIEQSVRPSDAAQNMYGISLYDRNNSYTARIRFDIGSGLQIQWWTGAGNFLPLQSFSTGTTYRIKIKIDTIGNNATVYINGVEKTRNQSLISGKAIQKWDNAVVSGGGLYYIDHIIIKKEVGSDLVTEPVIILGAEEIDTSSANETQGDQAIVSGINGALGPTATILTDQQIYVVNKTGGHNKGTFDKVAINVSQTWAFNYITFGESYTNIRSLSPTVNVWENQSLNSTNITTQVETFINQTKV